MKAFTQQPSPAGSRSVEKRTPFPQLGDGLLTALTCNATLNKSTTLADLNISTALTSKSLDQLAKSAHHGGDMVLVGTPSTCSDESDILIGRLDWSNKSKSSPRLSSQFSISGGDETPPTTLTGDDSSFSSNEETAPNPLPSTLVNSNTISITQTTSFPTSTSKGTTRQTERQSRMTTLISENPRDPYDSGHAIRRRVGKLPALLGSSSLHTSAGAIPDSEITPTAEYLHNIVRGFLGTEARAKGLIPLIPEPNQYEKIHENFRLKLATHSAQDACAGAVKPLHVFVDMSNIHIGFCNSWKVSQNIPVDRRVRAPAFNFKVLASIMERDRPAKKRVLASSVASHVVSRTQWPQHFVDAEKQGYKTSILSRVQKISPIKARRRRKTSSTQAPGVTHPSSVVTSGDESAEGLDSACYHTRNGEQGVDEILHLNMMNSILDDMQEPGSMVLATGDAAQAEFSEGFLEYATRALSQGWNIELVTWKAAISAAWVNPAFRDKYGNRFRVIYLDNFIEELNADIHPPYK